MSSSIEQVVRIYRGSRLHWSFLFRRSAEVFCTHTFAGIYCLSLMWVCILWYLKIHNTKHNKSYCIEVFLPIYSSQDLVNIYGKFKKKLPFLPVKVFSTDLWSWTTSITIFLNLYMICYALCYVLLKLIKCQLTY